MRLYTNRFSGDFNGNQQYYFFKKRKKLSEVTAIQRSRDTFFFRILFSRRFDLKKAYPCHWQRKLPTEIHTPCEKLNIVMYGKCCNSFCNKLHTCCLKSTDSLSFASVHCSSFYLFRAIFSVMISAESEIDAENELTSFTYYHKIEMIR